jgi:hypothetical protein
MPKVNSVADIYTIFKWIEIFTGNTTLNSLAQKPLKI